MTDLFSKEEAALAKETYSKQLRAYERRGVVAAMDFWNAFPAYKNRDRFTHMIHSYPAKLLASIPAFFIAIFCSRKCTILDPFCGSGTVLLEGALQGCRTYGAEINPIARMISQIKMTPIDPSILQERLVRILAQVRKGGRPRPEVPEGLDFWFTEEVITQLASLRQQLKSYRPSTDDNEILLRNFFWVCFSSLIRRKSLADPRVSPPVRLKPEKFSNNPARHQHTLRLVEQKRRADVFDVFETVCKENIERTRHLFDYFQNSDLASSGRIIWDDARAIRKSSVLERGVINHSAVTKFPSSSVDLVLTSPPYIDAQKYTRSLSLEMYWLEHWRGREDRAIYDQRVLGNGRVSTKGMLLNGNAPPILRKELLRIADSDRKRAAIVEAFFEGMLSVIKECHRVLKIGGHMILIVGNNKIFGKEIPTHRIMMRLLSQVGFTRELVIYDDIKTWGLMRERNSTADIITREWILIFRREP